jgi:hypothetical protein
MKSAKKIVLKRGIATALVELALPVLCAMAQGRHVNKIVLIFTLLISFNVFASEKQPWSAGSFLAFGSTTWYGLVPAQSNQNSAITVSAPIMADEGGFFWGFFAGYELTDNFGIELNYANYPDATLTFDGDSLFTFENENETILNTQTEAVSFMIKLMAGIPHTNLHMFLSIGPAMVHRYDKINNTWLLTPSFSIGFDHPINEDFTLEIMGNYTSGYGETEINPVEDFMPFLYSAGIRIAYHFNL